MPTPQHYKAIAEIVKDSGAAVEPNVYDSLTDKEALVRRLADYFAQESELDYEGERFDRDKFVAACYGKDGA